VQFELPQLIADMARARNLVRDHYQDLLRDQGGTAELKFTFDGNLVGDIGEALAALMFGIRLVDAKSNEGIDGIAPDGRTVQVKATGTGRGPAFRCVETRADHLLFFDLDLENCWGQVIFNGPEHCAVQKLPKGFSGQRSLSAAQIRHADSLVHDIERLPLVSMKGRDNA
jgi:hypothetical protein